MNVLISGASGLIGTTLARALTAGGDSVTRLVRRPGRAGALEATWYPSRGELDAGAVSGFDAVVHLSGENLAGGLWTRARKARIVGSRVDSTRLLSDRLASAERPPGVLVCASAVGYYGDRGGEVLTERDGPGDGFLATLAVDWEAAAAAAGEAGIRVVHLRSGVILDTLSMLVPVFKLGLGSVLGSGQQYLSWIALEDEIAAIQHVIEHVELAGPVNITSPEPVTNRVFTRTLARVLHRPAVLAVPAFALRLALGDLAEETLLASQRVVPERLAASGFRFQCPGLKEALRRWLQRR